MGARVRAKQASVRPRPPLCLTAELCLIRSISVTKTVSPSAFRAESLRFSPRLWIVRTIRSKDKLEDACMGGRKK